MKKRSIALALVAALALMALLPVLSAGAESPAGGYAFPLADEKITLKFMCCTDSTRTTKYSDMQIFKDYEALTNIHIEFIEVPSESWAEQVRLTLASGDLPDVYAGGVATIDSGLISQYAKQGIILPLEGLIDEHTVNMKKYLNENPTLRKVCTFSDGHIYSIPTLEENYNRAFIQFIVNKTWLDKLELDTPKTLDEFCNYLRLVKTTDLDENGQLDEPGFSVISLNSSLLNYLMGSFGVLDPGNHIYITDENEVVFSPITDEYRAFLTYMHGMYKEGLIDPESFTQDGTQFVAKASSSTGVAATIEVITTNLGASQVCEYHIAPPLTNNEGHTEWPKNNVINDLYLNSFSITKANQHPVETIKWLDYWMDNGVNGITMRYGTQGEYWDYLEDGEHWTIISTNPATGEEISTAMRSSVSPMAMVVPFWQFNDVFSLRVDTHPAGIEKGESQAWYDPYLSNPYPVVYASEEDMKTLSGIVTELDNYVNSSEALFITEGFTDDEWNAYVERCKDFGCEKYLEIYTNYYIDYLAK